MFTLSEIQEAYKAIDFKPVSEIFFDRNDKLCCPVTALFLKENGEPERLHCSTIAEWAYKKYGYENVLHFNRGFDGWGYADINKNNEQYKFGQQCRLELLPS